MSRLDEGRELVMECESRIRALMAVSVESREYDDVARLAVLAAALAAAAELALPSERAPAETQPAASTQPLSSERAGERMHSDPPKPLRKRPTAAYPRFERQGDRLIKLGWSKKERTEYEHRASLETVKAVVTKLCARMTKGGLIRMDELLPVELPDKTEIPSYQSYLVLAWLREQGTLQRQGNDGYKLTRKHFSPDDLKPLWAQTPERE